MIHALEDITKFSAIFEAMPGYNALLQVNPFQFTILAVTDDYLSNSGCTKEQLVGKGIFESFPSNPDDPNDTGEKNLLASFQYIIRHKKPHQLPVQRYDVTDENGSFSERYWVIKNKPVLNDEGEVIYIIHTAEEIINHVKAQEREEVIKGLEQVHNLFKQAPVAISILKGKDFIIEMANEQMIEIYGKEKKILQRPLVEVLPELGSQGFIDLLNDVVTTGKPYHGYESPLKIIENGLEKIKYYNFVYQRYYKADSRKLTGVLLFANDVTERVAIKKAFIESEKRFLTMAESTEIMIAVADEAGNSTYFNKAWVDLTGKPIECFLKLGWLDLVHPDDREGFMDIYLTALKDQKSFTGEFRILNKKGQYRWMLAKVPARFKADGSFAGYISSCIDITERKLAEEALIESSNKFQKLLEALPQLTWTNLPTGEVTFYNKRWYNYTGLKHEQTKGWGWKAIIHPEDLISTLKDYTAALESGNVFVTENRYKRFDGSYRWHLNRALPIRNEKGEITIWIGTATDIHDLKQAEASLQESEQRIRSLVESAPFPIGVYIGQEMKIELANQAIIDVWGKGNDVIGKLYSDVLPELNNQKIFTQIQSVFNTGIPLHAKNQRLDLVVEGKLQTYYFNYSFMPLRNSNGKVYGVMNTAADVSDLNFAKHKIEESEAQLRSLVMSAPIGICIVKGNPAMVEVVNDSFLEVFGKRREAFEYTPYWEVLPEAAAYYTPIFENVLRTGVMFRGDDHEVMLIRNGKEEIVYVNFVYDPVKEADGTVSKVMIVVIEVTEQVIARRKIEEVVAERTKELAEANRNLKKSNEALEQFAYIASHDLQEPLRKVRTFSQMLEKSLPGIDESAKNYFNKINNSTTRMSNLIRDVLAYSQLSKENEIYDWVNLQELVDWLKNDFELLIEQKQATIQSSNLPTIQAISLQMSQLISNLISNSLKFSTADVKPVITIVANLLTKDEVATYTLDQNAVYYNIEFKDNGIGFKQEHATRIFNVFQRLHGKTQYAGTGIGLAMCKKIVQNHHGDIYATASKGTGAIFNVILPERQVSI